VRQLVKGAARAGGRGVFQGKFRVDRAAQLTDARMRHSALLLEAAAEAFAKPELEIYADNVQCAHGSTSGQLDADALFYLRQRGLPEPAARALLTRAFLAEALPDWLPEPQRAEVEARIDRWLAGAAA
jgi:Fe-S cluster assembly protein SufD